LPQETPELVLPFSVLSQNRREQFPEETEKATVFCLAQMEKRKGGGIVIKQPPEKISFIAKTYYPLWVAPFHEANLVFDGLKAHSHALLHPEIQEIPAFIGSAERSSSSRQAYAAFLSDNQNYFQVSDRQEKTVLDGLLAEPAFLQGFDTYVAEAGLFEASRNVTVLPSTIDGTVISLAINELESLKAKFAEEVRDLGKGMKLLNATTKEFAKNLLDQIRETRDSFNKELKKHRGPVEEKVKEIRSKCDAEITVISKKFEKELLRLQKEKVKREKTKDQLNRRVEHCEAEIKTSAKSKNAVGERKWKEEREKLKKELSIVESEIKRFEKDLKETEDKKTAEILTIKSNCDSKAQEANRELVEIESSRDAKTQILKQEIDKMEELTSTIIKQMDNTAKLREASITVPDKLGIQPKQKKLSIIYMPFYLVCFQSASRKRYMVIPPSTVNSVKLLVKLKGALGKARIKQLFNPRSPAIGSFLSKFPSLMEKNAVFERETNEAGEKTDLLKASVAREQIESGLRQLRAEGWFSDKEYEAFSKILP
jgi:hypothetical protein